MFWPRTLALALVFAADSIYYGVPTLTPFNFLITNMSPISLFYGVNPWHYYFSQALPILCTTSLPFILRSVWLNAAALGRPEAPTSSILLGCVVWTTIVYSLAGHKEWRFLHPLLPMLHVIAAKSIVDTSPRKIQNLRVTRSGSRRAGLMSYLPPIRPTYLCLLLLNVPVSIYVVLFYCDGPVTVMKYLRKIPSEELRNGTIGFLMPCHSTPWQAYVHREELSDSRKMWALGCEPPLG